LTDEDEIPPPLETNGTPKAQPNVSDIVTVQNFLAGLIRESEHRVTDRFKSYIEDHKQTHREHLLDVRPYLDYVDREVQKDKDWDARLKPPLRIVTFLARNWRTIAPFAIAALIALGVVRGEVRLGQ
jgi:hypothetical protein